MCEICGLLVIMADDTKVLKGMVLKLEEEMKENAMKINIRYTKV